MKKRFIRLLKNKYALTASFFIIWVCVFSEVDAVFMFQRKIELSRKKSELEQYVKLTTDARESLEELKSSEKLKEKFAREQYLMKKDDEDIFLLREN